MADAANNTDSEIWKDIPEWPDYQVSNMGRVRVGARVRLQTHPRNRSMMKQVTYPAALRRQSICPQTGYAKVGLSKPGKKQTVAVHVLVCEAFHGPRPKGHDAAHGNGIRTDSRADNLRWATRKENRADCKSHGTNNHGERNGQSKLTEDQVRAIRRAHANGKMPTALGLEYGLNPRHVSDIVAGRRWGHVE